MTQRGDLVTASLQGNYGKPRPALVVQSDLLMDLERPGYKRSASCRISRDRGAKSRQWAARAFAGHGGQTFNATTYQHQRTIWPSR